MLLLEEVLVDALPPEAVDSARGELHLSKAGPWWGVGPFWLLIKENNNFLSEVGINRKDGP